MREIYLKILSFFPPTADEWVSHPSLRGNSFHRKFRFSARPFVIVRVEATISGSFFQSDGLLLYSFFCAIRIESNLQV